MLIHNQDRDEPFLCIEGAGSNARLCLLDEEFPLTIAGCIAAGRFLFQEGFDHWMYSSSCDFPREHKRWFTNDVRDLVKDGWQDEELELMLEWLP